MSNTVVLPDPDTAATVGKNVAFVYQVDPVTNKAVSPGGGGGGGGGAVTVADGADTAQGTTTDAAWGLSGAATAIAVLKKVALLLNTIDGGIPVTNFPGTQPVSGTVTANIGTSGSLALETGGHLANLDTDLGALADAAWGLSGNGSVVAVLKKIALLLNTIDAGIPVTNFPATQPVSAASLPLPSGAATAAKQPALGTAGSASSDVISIQGIASMTPVNSNLAQVGAASYALGAATVAASQPITNAAVQGWIGATGTGTVSADDTLTFASQVRKVVLYNASANPVPFEFDGAAAATSFPIQPGQTLIFDDVLCTTIHVFPSATLPINTTSGLYVKGWK